MAAVVLIALAAGTAALVAYSSRTGDELARQTTYVPRPTVMTPDVELLQQYIRFDTSNPPGNELAAAEWLAGKIREGGVAAEVIESAPGRANVYARIKGKQNGTGLLLLHHIDVVPASSAAWKRPPFAAEIWLDQLYGRGALDVKGPGICFLRAFLDVAAAKTPPEHDLVYLAVADEEAGGTLGMEWLIANRPDVIAGVRYALNEGGITEMQAERVTYYGIEIATKLQVVLRVVAPTLEPLRQARIALEPWFTPDRQPHRILPEVRRFFRDIAPSRLEFRDELEDIDQAIAQGKFWRLPVGYRELTQNNVFMHGPVARPSGGYEARVLLLNLPDEDPDARIAWLAKMLEPFGVRIDEVERKSGPVPISSPDTPFFELLREEATAAFGAPAGTEFLNRSYNDSRFLRRAGIQAYGINPFAVDFFQSESIHNVDERLRVTAFTEGIVFTSRVVGRYVRGR